MADTKTSIVPAASFEFMSVPVFKEQIGATSIQVLRSPKEGGGLFVVTNTGARYNCQQSFDADKPASMLIPDGDITKACLINPSSQAEVLATL